MSERKISNVKITKKTFYLIIAGLVFVLVAGYFGFGFYKEKAWENEVNSYKKFLYDSTVCQYSCPLEEQQIGNSSLLLPEKECVTSCLEGFRNSGIDANKFSNNDLMKDGLVLDIQDKVVACKRDSANLTGERERAESFVSCVGNSLRELKETYGYLE